MELSNHLERLKSDQRERRIEYAKNFHKMSDVAHVRISSDIRWYERYIRYVEDKVRYEQGN